jgi:hypothetical protein
MMARYYIKFLGAAGKVDDLVGLAPSNHGTTNPGAIAAGATFCEACAQQTAGSPFLAQLNGGDETPGAVSYTQIETRYDEVVTPYTSAFLAPGPKTATILLPGCLPGRGDRPPRDAQRRARDPLGPAGPRTARPRGPDSRAQLRVAPRVAGTDEPPRAGWPAGLDVFSS